MDIVWTWDVIRRIIEVLWLINIAFAVWTVFRSRRYCINLGMAISLNYFASSWIYPISFCGTTIIP